MGQIEACTDALTQAIRESAEYRRFCEVRDRVAADPELRRRINEFRRHVFETQNSREPLDMYEEMKRIGRDYEEFRREPLVEEYLRCELRVCRIIQQITLAVAGSVDLDTQDVTEGIQI